MKNPVFSISNLEAVLSKLPDSKRYLVAYSGGVDSCVLLYALSQIKEKINQEIIAVHVNHSLSKNADKWEKHCLSVCNSLDINYKSINIDVSNREGKSSEAWARELRYKALEDLLQDDDLLLTAHHQDDQAETILLQLLRGSGPEGLAGMPIIRPFGCGWLARPFLSFTREQLVTYAEREQLKWIEDESNYNTMYDRNYIRKNIFPVIKERWPAAARTLSRAASHQADVIELLKDIAEADLNEVYDPDTEILEIDKFNKLSISRKKNVLRAWLRRLNLPIPNTDITENIITELIDASIDSEPCIRWDGAEIRRYRNQVYGMSPLPEHDNKSVHVWKISKQLQLDIGILEAKLSKGEGLKTNCVKNQQVEVRYRQGGERIHPAGRSHTCELKKYFQESGIPPWQRDRIPLIYIDGELAAVADIWINDALCASNNEEGWLISLADST